MGRGGSPYQPIALGCRSLFSIHMGSQGSLLRPCYLVTSYLRSFLWRNRAACQDRISSFVVALNQIYQSTRKGENLLSKLFQAPTVISYIALMNSASTRPITAYHDGWNESLRLIALLFPSSKSDFFATSQVSYYSHSKLLSIRLFCLSTCRKAGGTEWP